jgi:dienelactone hydrolase
VYDLADRSVHSASLGAGKSDDTLIKIRDKVIQGEVTMVFGKQDTHVDRAGRTLIRDTLDEAGVTFSVSFAMTRLNPVHGSTSAACLYT